MNNSLNKSGKKHIAYLLLVVMMMTCVSCKAAGTTTAELTFNDNVMIISCGENYAVASDNPDEQGRYTIKNKNDGKDIMLSFFSDSDFEPLETEMMTWTKNGFITDTSFVFDGSGNGRLKFTGSNGQKEYFREVRYLKGTDIYAILDTFTVEGMSGFDEISIQSKEIVVEADHAQRINDLGNYMLNYAGTMANTQEGLEALNASGTSDTSSSTSDNAGAYSTNENFDESLVSEDAVRKVAQEFGYTDVSSDSGDGYVTTIYSKPGSIAEIHFTLLSDLTLTDEYYRSELASTGYDKVPNPVVMRVPDEEGYARYYAAMHDDDAVLVIFTDDADECSKISAKFGLVYNADSDAYDEITYGEEPGIPDEGITDLSMGKYRAVASYFGIIDDVSEEYDSGNIVGGDFMDGTTMSHAWVEPRYVQATFEEMLKAYGIQGPNPCVFKINSRFIVIAYDTSGNIVMVSAENGNRLAQICTYFGIKVTKE